MNAHVWPSRSHAAFGSTHHRGALQETARSHPDLEGSRSALIPRALTQSHSLLQRRLGPWLVLALLVPGMLPVHTRTWAAQAVTHDLSGARDYLENPPRYRSLLLRRTLAAAPIAFRRPADAQAFVESVRRGETTVPSDIAWFEIRFQSEPPSFLLRALTDPQDLPHLLSSRLHPLAGRYDTRWWSILEGQPGQVQLLVSSNGHDTGPEGVTNRYHWGNERWATEFLRLGLLDVLTEDLRWLPGRTEFTARLENGSPVRGWFESGPETGVLQIQLTDAKGTPLRRVQVRADPNQPRWIPRHLNVELPAPPGPDTDSPWNHYAEYEALSYELSDTQLPRAHFSPEPFLNPEDLWVELERGALYVLHADGTNVIRTLAPEARATWNLTRALTILLLILLAAAALTLGWRFAREWYARSQ
jgi:hypothetical protein